MNKEHLTENFEQVLLSYTEMCYSVALALTRNPVHARDLTRNVLTWAWHGCDRRADTRTIKAKLLTVLRETYLQEYRRAALESPARVSKATCAPGRRSGSLGSALRGERDELGMAVSIAP